MYILGTTLGSYFKWSILPKKSEMEMLGRSINQNIFLIKYFIFDTSAWKFIFSYFQQDIQFITFDLFHAKSIKFCGLFTLLLKAMLKNLQSMRIHCWRKGWSSYINSKDRLKILILVIENLLIYFLTIYSDWEFTQNMIRFYRSQFCKVLTFNFARKLMK